MPSDSTTKHFLLFLFTSTLLLLSEAYGQHVSDYSIRHFTSENGLPQNSVKAITADKYGLIWLATENGLVRFDGTRFRVFDKSNTAISQNRFYDFQPSLNGDDALYATADWNEYLRIEGGKAYRDSVYFKSTSALLPLDSLWLSYRAVTGNSRRIQEYVIAPDKNIFPLSNASGTFYMCDSNKVHYYSNWKKQGEALQVFGDIRCIFKLNNGLAFVDHNGAVCRYSEGPRLVKNNLKLIGDILDNPAYHHLTKKIRLLWDNTTDQTFFILEGCLYSVKLTTDTTLHTRLILSGWDFDSLGIVSGYYHPESSRLFLGSSTEGLYELRKKNFSTLRINKNERENIFYAQGIYSDSSVIVSNGYEIGLTNSGSTWKKARPSIIKSYPNPLILLTDHEGLPWIQSYSSIVRFNREANKVVSSWEFDDQPVGIFQDSDRNVWIVLVNGKMFRIEYKSELKNIEFVLQTAPRTTCLVILGRTIWLGTAKGLFETDIQKKTTKIVAGTDQMNIRSIYAPTPEKIWLTTYESGFLLLQNKKLTQFPLDRENRLATSHCIFEDRNAFFWIPTNRGLFRVSKDDLLKHEKAPEYKPYYHLFTMESGFNTNEFNGGCQPCAVRLSNDYVSIPSIKGLVWFKPESIETEKYLKDLLIDEVNIDGQPVVWKNQTLSLPSRPGLLNLSLVSSHFDNQHNELISYNMGYGGKISEKWVPIDDDKIIRISNLPSGQHVLRIKRQTGLEQDAIQNFEIKIKVAKAWHETLFFYFALALLVILIVYSAIYIQNRVLVRRNQRLETAIRERTESLRHMLEALEDSEAGLSRQVRLQTQMIASLTHDVRTPLYAIRTISEELGLMVRLKKFDRLSKIGELITDSVSRVLGQLENTVTYIKIHAVSSKVALEPLDLHAFVNLKFDLFRLSAQNKNVKLVNAISTDTTVRSNPYLLGIILNNLIDNAIKNTTNGSVSLEVERSGQETLLVVCDTGRGIPAPIVKWLNDYKDLTKDTNAIKPSGIGLVIVKEIARMMQSEIKVHTSKNGTRFTIPIIENPDFQDVDCRSLQQSNS